MIALQLIRKNSSEWGGILKCPYEDNGLYTISINGGKSYKYRANFTITQHKNRHPAITGTLQMVSPPTIAKRTSKGVVHVALDHTQGVFAKLVVSGSLQDGIFAHVQYNS